MKRAACTAALLVVALSMIAAQTHAQTVAKPGVAVIAADPGKVQEIPGKKPAKAATSGAANGAALATRINSGQKAPRTVALPSIVPAGVPTATPSYSSAATSAAARDSTASPPVRRAPVTAKSKPPTR